MNRPDRGAPLPLRIRPARIGLVCAIATSVLAATSAPAAAQTPALERARVSLVADRTAALPGDTVELALRFELAPGWHIYWKHPGESGIATTVTWELPRGARVDSLAWPVPSLYETAGIFTHVHHGEVVLRTRLILPEGRPGTARIPVAADVRFGVCRDVCFPGQARVTLMLGPGRGRPDRAWPRLERLSLARAPERGGPLLRAVIHDSTVALTITPRGNGRLSPGDYTFFPNDRSLGRVAVRGTVRPGQRSLTLTLRELDGTPTEVAGVLVFGDPTVERPRGWAIRERGL